MKIILISDTHNQHEKLTLPEGDMIIHAGDVSGGGSHVEVLSFLYWFARLPFKYKIFIAGNHDFLLERKMITESDFPDGVTYLKNSMVEIEDLRIYGSPYTPKFSNWAFMKKRGEDMRNVWTLIPRNVDILVTHGPPFMILDQTAHGAYIGCEGLLNRVKELKPKVHVLGHVHEGYGIKEEFGVNFINASVLNENYRLINEPIVIGI
jgi:Icc-related predicted phosphoesterase